MYKLNKSEAEILVHKLLHSAVDCRKHFNCICLLLFSTDSTNSHKSALFLTKLIVTGEIVLKKEAGISHKTVFTDKTELGAYCINSNRVEIPD